MKEQNTADPIREEREYYRSLFWAAFALYREKGMVSTPSTLPDDSYSTPSAHDPAWEKWCRWRAEFEGCAKKILHGGMKGMDQTQWIVFHRHIIHLELEWYKDEDGKSKSRWVVNHPGLPIEKTIALIQRIYGADKAIGMYHFYSTKEIIAEKVGGALERDGLWPISEYLKGEAA